ncbi:MAG: hypothetical protein K2X72_20105 [Reyranella sp.]|nr:hypothetical protein [Reyranella sp.]
MNDYLARNGNKGWGYLTMYGTGEACPMCASAMVSGRIFRAWCTAPTRRSCASTSPTSTFAPRPSSTPARQSTPASSCWAACWRTRRTSCSKPRAKSARRSRTSNGPPSPVRR